MNFEQMRRLCGWNFKLVGPALLPDFELGLDNRGYFNIRSKVGNKIFGVLYFLKNPALAVLDEFEGHPDVFNRIEVDAQMDGQKYPAWVYLEAAEHFNGKFINGDHLKRVISGAIENHLPKEWIDFLNSFKSISG